MGALDILQQLIRIRTPQPKGDELDAVKFIVSLLSSGVFENRILHHGENRATLISEIEGKDRENRIAFVCNLDTVGLENAASWAHSPYAADFENGKIYGRGAANNKGGVAAILLTALALAEDPAPPPKSVLFCFTADGDAGATGASALVEGGFFEGVDEIVFAQPTNCDIGIGQKGFLWIDCRVTGRSSHVTRPHLGVDALQALLRFAGGVERLLEREKAHFLLGRPVCNVTEISAQGPTSYSIPDRAAARLDIRIPPNIDDVALLGNIRAIAEGMMSETDDLRIEVDVVNKKAAVGMSATAPIIRKLKRVYGRLKLKPNLYGLLFFTDASTIVPRVGVPFAIVGPGEDIYGRRDDESIALDGILLASKIYLEFIREL